MGDSSKNAVNLLRIEVGHPHTGQFKAGYLPKGQLGQYKEAVSTTTTIKTKTLKLNKASNKKKSNVYSLRPVLGIII